MVVAGQTPILSSSGGDGGGHDRLSSSVRCVLVANAQVMPIARRIVIEWGRGGEWGADIGKYGEEVAGRYPLGGMEQTPATNLLRSHILNHTAPVKKIDDEIIRVDWQVWDLPEKWPDHGGGEKATESLMRAVYTGPEECRTRVAIVVANESCSDASRWVKEARKFLAPGEPKSINDHRVPHVPMIIVHVLGCNTDDSALTAPEYGTDAAGYPVVSEIVPYIPGHAHFIAAAAVRAIHRSQQAQGIASPQPNRSSRRCCVLS